MISERLLAALEGDAAALDHDAEPQLEAARTGVALGWLGDESFIRIGGSERASFLHRLLTAEVATLGVDRGRRALLLDTRGHVLADLDLWGGAEHWTAMLDRGVRDQVIETLQRFVLRADVTLEASDRAALALAGPRAGGLLQRVGAAAPGRYETVRAEIGGVAVAIRGTARVPWAWVLQTERPAAALIEAFERAEPEITQLGPAAQDALRIEAGIPRVGRELRGAEFPQEALLEEAISFDKGCYLGQETVARIHYRGHVNRLLCRLAPDVPIEAPALLELDGREVGGITSASGVGAPVALGYVRREHAAPGTKLEVCGRPGRFVTVREPTSG